MDARAEAERIIAGARAEREHARREGYDEGRAQAAAELAGLLAAGRAEADAMLEQTAPAALAIATRMAEKIVGRAVELEPAVMADIAAEALAACRTRTGIVALRVHPDDLAAVQARRAELAAGLGGEVTFELVADETVERHGCVVDTAVGRIDARLSTLLAALASALSGEAHA
jgi:flagellar biosynthesis/type III secretory pathway protein FliH